MHTVKEITRETLSALPGFDSVILYGCGLYGGRIREFLAGEGVAAVACCDASPAKWGGGWKGLPVLSPADAAKVNDGAALFVITIASYNQTPLEKVEAEVVAPLERLGCRNICYATDLYQQFGRLDCAAHGADLSADSLIVDGVKLPNFFADPNPAMQSSFGQAISELLYLPPPEDRAAYYDAPYAPGDPIGLAAGDIVIDCGANLGTFSNLAAAKGCRVHAFEPSPETAERMRRSAALYPGQIEVCQLALSDKPGTASFQTGTASAIADRLAEDDGAEGCIAVTVTTLDAFVAREGLARVDFIKSDIEGEERNMLAGATETLRRFGPKLSISSYHLPDDPEVLEAVVMRANPRYTVKHVKNKMYAWVH